MQTDGSAVLVVTDQGMGISPENQKRIFMPYERAVSVHNISGLGMGLYISDQIIRSHHGKIEVKSRLGKGSAFKVTLPLALTEV